MVKREKKSGGIKERVEKFWRKNYQWIIVDVIVIVLFEGCNLRNDYVTRKIEEEHYEWEEEQAKEENRPNFQPKKEKRIPLGEYTYEKYTLYNSGEHLTSAKMYLQAELIVWYGNDIVKSVAIDDAFYNNVIDYQVEMDELSFLLWNPDELESVRQVFENNVKDYVVNKGVEFSKVKVDLYVVAGLAYTTSQNKSETMGYVLTLGDEPSCTRNKESAYYQCDRYHITRATVETFENEEEYKGIVQETGERLLRLMKI